MVLGDYKEYANNIKAIRSYEFIYRVQDILSEVVFNSKSNSQNMSCREIIRIIRNITEGLKHDGYTKYRGYLSSDYIKKFVAKGYGINCLMTAIFTQDELEKINVKSILVQGVPHCYEYRDVHWFLLIYSEKDNTWFFADPVWNGYVSDEKSNYLDFFEIRKFIKEGKKIYISENNKFGKYHFLLTRYLFAFGIMRYQGFATFEMKPQEKLYFSPMGFDMADFIEKKEKDRFLPFCIDEYLYFSRFEEKAKFL